MSNHAGHDTSVCTVDRAGPVVIVTGTSDRTERNLGDVGSDDGCIGSVDGASGRTQAVNVIRGYEQRRRERHTVSVDLTARHVDVGARRGEVSGNRRTADYCDYK